MSYGEKQNLFFLGENIGTATGFLALEIFLVGLATASAI